MIKQNSSAELPGLKRGPHAAAGGVYVQVYDSLMVPQLFATSIVIVFDPLTNVSVLLNAPVVGLKYNPETVVPFNFMVISDAELTPVKLPDTAKLLLVNVAPLMLGAIEFNTGVVHGAA